MLKVVSALTRLKTKPNSKFLISLEDKTLFDLNVVLLKKHLKFVVSRPIITGVGNPRSSDDRFIYVEHN